MAGPLFKNKNLQDSFDRDGYVVFDFITPQEAKYIASKFYELYSATPKGFYSTAENQDFEVKKKIQEHAEQVLEAPLHSYFENFKKLGITFLTKAPGPEGKVPVHRDWMVVDETKYFTGTIWIPLQDVDDNNGALKVWPGSHLLFNDFRGSNLPVAYQGYEDEIFEQMLTVPMKAGQAFLLNHAVMHASAPNITDKDRLVIVCGITHKDAKFNFYVGTNHGTVEKFDMPDDMFLRHFEVHGRPTIGVKVEEFECNVVLENRLRIQQMITSTKLERSSRPMLADETLQRQLWKNGFLKIPVPGNGLMNIINGLMKDALPGKLNSAAAEKIAQVMNENLAFTGGPARVIDISYELKKAGSSEVGNLQQQPSYTADEDECAVLNCVIPLADINIKSGAPAFIPGSHLFIGNKRPFPVSNGRYKFKGDEREIYPYLQTAELKAGEVLITDARLFSVNMPNTSAVDVPVITFKLVHPAAHVCCYYLNPAGRANEVVRYKANSAFNGVFDNTALTALYQNRQLPEGYEVEEKLVLHSPEFTIEELKRLVIAAGGSQNGPLKKQLESLPAYRDYLAGKTAIAPGSNFQKSEARPRGLFQIYSPANILREIKKRVLG